MDDTIHYRDETRNLNIPERWGARPSVGRPQQTTALIAVLPFWLHDGAVQPGDARGKYLLNQSYKNEHF